MGKAEIPHTLPLDSLRPLGDWLAALADDCHADAADHELRQERRARIGRETDARFQQLDSAAGVLASYLVNGKSPDQAVHAAARTTGLEAADLVRLLSPARKEAKRRQVNRRNRRIMRLRARGYSDKEIGERVGLHGKSVARIIGQELRRAA